MTSPRASAPGHRRPGFRRTGPFLLILGVFLLAACGAESGTGAPTTGASAAPTLTPTAIPSTEPGSSATPAASATGESSEPTEAPTDAPSDSPSTGPSDSPLPTGSGVASGCTGTDKNQGFYASVAAAVDWAVYCPHLPAGWSVVSGQYRLAGGGRMEIGYKGPAGAKITLREGAFCQDANGCVPSGTEIGAAAFGDQSGTLVAAADGTWVIVVAQGANPSWILIAQVASEDDARAIGAALIVVPD